MEKEKGEDEFIKELDKEQRDIEVFDEKINKKALKIGRKVLDEMCLHNENKIEINIRKSDLFDWSVIEVGVHTITGLLKDEIEFIKREGLREKYLDDFEIKSKVIDEK